jgi:hypothetical protein
MPANPGHTIQHCRHLLLHMEVADVSQPLPPGPLAMLMSGLCPDLSTSEHPEQGWKAD